MTTDPDPSTPAGRPSFNKRGLLLALLLSSPFWCGVVALWWVVRR